MNYSTQGRLRYCFPNQRNSMGIGNCCFYYGIMNSKEVDGCVNYTAFKDLCWHYRIVGPYHFFEQNSNGEDMAERISENYEGFAEIFNKTRR